MKILKKHWRVLFGLYVFIYMPWFIYLEKTITADYPNLHILNTSFDNSIPFCKYFIIPYILWFAYIFFACIFMFFKGTDKEYLNFALSLVIGMSICLGICMIYPSGLTLRPDTLPNDIFGKLVGMIYASDTPTNVFPSIHVYNSLAIDIAIRKCKYLENRKAIKNCSTALCLIICISTIFVKQHSVIDVIGGFILMGIMYVALYVIDYSKVLKKNVSNEVELNNNY